MTFINSSRRRGSGTEVKTVFVAEGSTIEIKGRSSESKGPDSIKGNVYNDEFIGKLLIPEKVKLNAEIWFEAKLPKHGLKMESWTTDFLFHNSDNIRYGEYLRTADHLCEW